MASSSAAGLSLDEQLCFALYSASRALTAGYRRILEPLGLTYPQYLVMLVLWESEPISVGRLGARLELDSGTLSPLLKRLESTGLISRHRSPADERSVEIRLTATGRGLRRRAAEVPALIRASTGIGDEQARELGTQLRALAARVRVAANLLRTT
jgi:DNA-binding MarR family transcriptional regulator